MPQQRLDETEEEYLRRLRKPGKGQLSLFEEGSEGSNGTRSETESEV